MWVGLSVGVVTASGCVSGAGVHPVLTARVFTLPAGGAGDLTGKRGVGCVCSAVLRGGHLC